MKQILIIIALFIGINTYANDTTQYVTNSNVEKLVDKYSEKLSATITSLAQSLKQPAEHVYKILVKQQVVKAVTGLIIFIITLCLIIYFMCLLNGKAELINDDGDPTAKGILAIITAILSGIFILAFFAAGYHQDIIQGFLNPEYGAIKDIVEMIK